MTDPVHVEALRQEAQLDTLKQQIAAKATELHSATRARTQVSAEAAHLARLAHATGMPETHIATAFGVNRRTVRRWLGKPGP